MPHDVDLIILLAVGFGKGPYFWPYRSTFTSTSFDRLFNCGHYHYPTHQVSLVLSIRQPARRARV